jgi:hypothetical protein
MISVFTSKNSATFVAAKSFLEKERIPFIPKGENSAGLEYTSFEILVKDEDYERAKNLIAGIERNSADLEEKYSKRNNPFLGYLTIAGILIAAVLLFALGLWIRGMD